MLSKGHLMSQWAKKVSKDWQKYKVDKAVYGHVHNYERTCPIYEVIDCFKYKLQSNEMNICTTQEKSHYEGPLNGVAVLGYSIAPRQRKGEDLNELSLKELRGLQQSFDISLKKVRDRKTRVGMWFQYLNPWLQTREEKQWQYQIPAQETLPHQFCYWVCRRKNTQDKKLFTEHMERKERKANNKEVEKPKEVIHVRARRGQATDSHNLAHKILSPNWR